MIFFPEWALDLGLIKIGIIYSFYKYFANIQYSVADIIGVQTPSNLTYLSSWIEKHGKTVEVLNNWQTPLPNIGTGIDLSLTDISGRKIFIYIGNMGVAQNIDVLIDLAEILKYRNDIGFVFIGRGSEVQRLKKE